MHVDINKLHNKLKKAMIKMGYDPESPRDIGYLAKRGRKAKRSGCELCWEPEFCSGIGIHPVNGDNLTKLAMEYEEELEWQ